MNLNEAIVQVLKQAAKVNSFSRLSSPYSRPSAPINSLKSASKNKAIHRLEDANSICGQTEF